MQLNVRTGSGSDRVCRTIIPLNIYQSLSQRLSETTPDQVATALGSDVELQSDFNVSGAQDCISTQNCAVFFSKML